MIERSKDRARLRRSLLRWYDRNHRRLPWRATRDPYFILVSEYLLQQTRVAQALPYYLRFVRRFPTIETLARARTSTVLKTWEGLGYYARARNLHRAARMVMSNFDGKIPQSPEQLQRLPGCGPYTSAAIASIAFGVPAPVIDGNVIRLLSRAFGLSGDPNKITNALRLSKLAQELLSPRQPGRFNQALMELGATICVPKNPKCTSCCWKCSCAAFRLGLTDRLPQRRPRAPIPEREIAIGVVWYRGRVLLARRRPDALLGGLWEFPGGKRKPRESLRSCCAREIQEEVGLSVLVRRKLMVLRFAYTHFKVRLHVFECIARLDDARPFSCDRVVWERPEKLVRYPFPAANRPLIRALQEGRICSPGQ